MRSAQAIVDRTCSRLTHRHDRCKKKYTNESVQEAANKMCDRGGAV